MWFVSGLILGLCYGFMIWSQSRSQYEELYDRFKKMAQQLQQQCESRSVSPQRRERSLCSWQNHIAA